MKIFLILLAMILTAPLAWAWRCDYRKSSTNFDASTVDRCYLGALQHLREGVRWKISKEYGEYLFLHGVSVVRNSPTVRSKLKGFFEEAELYEGLIKDIQPCPTCSCESDDDE